MARVTSIKTGVSNRFIPNYNPVTNVGMFVKELVREIKLIGSQTMQTAPLAIGKIINLQSLSKITTPVSIEDWADNDYVSDLAPVTIYALYVKWVQNGVTVFKDTPAPVLYGSKLTADRNIMQLNISASSKLYQLVNGTYDIIDYDVTLKGTLDLKLGRIFIEVVKQSATFNDIALDSFEVVGYDLNLTPSP